MVRLVLKVGGEAAHVAQGVLQVFGKVAGRLFAGDGGVVLVAEVAVADGPVARRAEVGGRGKALPLRNGPGQRVGEQGCDVGDDGACLLLQGEGEMPQGVSR